MLFIVADRQSAAPLLQPDPRTLIEE
jgi:hypothetical protein